jgi:hypothetical protein
MEAVPVRGILYLEFLLRTVLYVDLVKFCVKLIEKYLAYMIAVLGLNPRSADRVKISYAETRKSKNYTQFTKFNKKKLRKV